MIPTLTPVALDEHTSLAAYDALVVVSPTPLEKHLASLSLPADAKRALEEGLAIDAALGRGARAPVVIIASGVPGKRLVLTTVGALTDDADDVRALADAASAAVSRAVEAGARKPVLVVAAPTGERFAFAREVAALAALGTHWSPLEGREAGKKVPAIENLGVVGLTADRARVVHAIETGRALARDITGTEPERMAPMRVAELCEKAFAGTNVKVTVTRDVSSWPLIAAVSRASMKVERHRPCVVRLEYTPAGPVSRTLYIAGKGVTYDMGGADLKTDGAMAGMSRDKGGAGAAAGFVRALAAMDAKGVRVVALLGMVRNSIGDDAFVSDEIITSHSGVRVRIGNTDAEGRLVLADLLSTLRAESTGAPDPVLLSVATLTGHVYRAFGPYVGAIENGVSRARGIIDSLDRLGEAWGEPIEFTRPRREDYAFVAARSSAEDVVSANRLASVNTPRGHQGPYAFLDVTAGLKGGALPYVHLDIGGVAVSPADWQFGRPTGNPIALLAAFAGVWKSEN